MKSRLYFSMQHWNESQDEWLRRTAPAYEHRNHSQGLSGKPNRQGIIVEPTMGIAVVEGKKSKAGNIVAVTKYIDVPLQREIAGVKREVVRIGYGRRSAKSVESWARGHGYDYYKENGNGCSGMCERIDGMAYKGPKYFSRDEIYSNDNH